MATHMSLLLPAPIPLLCLAATQTLPLQSALLSWAMLEPSPGLKEGIVQALMFGVSVPWLCNGHDNWTPGPETTRVTQGR